MFKTRRVHTTSNLYETRSNVQIIQQYLFMRIGFDLKKRSVKKFNNKKKKSQRINSKLKKPRTINKFIYTYFIFIFHEIILNNTR